jgi:CysZ protein
MTLVNDCTTKLGFAHGLKSLPRACGVLVRAPRILLWLIPPLLITLLFDVLAFYYGYGWLCSWIESLLPESWNTSWLQALIGVLCAVAVIFLLGWSFAWVYLTITSPFQDFISAAVEREVHGSAGPEPEGWKGFLRSIWQSVVQAIVLTLLTLIFLVIGLVPLLGAIVFFIWSAFTLGYAFVSIPSGRMAQRFSERLAFARRHRGAVLGLGVVIAITSLVPILNVICLPIFVIAGTLLYLDVNHGTTTE